MARLREKKRVEERDNLFDAEAIFREVREQVTPQTVAFYKRQLEEQRQESPALRGYALAIERQSEGGRVLRDVDETGHIGRVHVIERCAKQHGLYLPTPIERPNRKQGETPFIFDEHFWFVDGENARATGFSMAPEIRPRFWHAYAMIRVINEIDPSARPSALIVADYVRFM